MAVQIQFRRDTTANWASANSVLAAGEMGINTSTNQFKIGDGSTAWNSLSYAPLSGTVADLDDVTNVVITSAANGDLLKWNGSAWVNAAGYALLASPTFTGTPTLPTGTIATTQTVADNSTKVATTAFVRGEVTALVNSAPGTLDTLNELALALGSDAAFSTTVTNSLGLKAPLASPTFTGTPTLPTGTIATTQTANNNSTALATTAYVDTADALKANIASPTFTGTPTLPTGTIATTQTAGNNTTALATTAFVTTAVAGAAITALNDIGDVTITSASADQLLKWNGSAWVNATIALTPTWEDANNILANAVFG